MSSSTTPTVMATVSVVSARLGTALVSAAVPAEHLHRDGHRVVDEQGDGGDLGDLRPEVVAGDDVGAAGLGVEPNDLEVRQRHEEQNAEDDERDRDDQAEGRQTDVGDHLGQHLLGAVGRGRDAVGRQDAERDGPAQAFRGQLLGHQRRPEEPVLHAIAPGLGDVLARDAGEGNRRACRGWWGSPRPHSRRNLLPPPIAASDRFLQDPTRRVALWRARHRGRVWPGGLRPRRLAQRGGPFRGRDGQVVPAFRRLKGWDGPCIVGSGFDRDDLEEAGALDADALAAVTSGDNTNILTARIARETYKIPNVVARIYDPRRAEIYQRLASPPWPRSPGPSTRSAGGCCPTRTSATGPTRRGA